MTMQSSAKDHPEVIVFPPVIPVGGLVLGLILEHFFPVAAKVDWPPPVWRGFVGIALLLVGIAFMVSARVTLKKAGTNVHPGSPALHLVESGPFRRSRNPMYLGGNLVLVGLSLVFRLYWIPVLMPVLIMICHYGVILREEAYLERRFGQVYIDYKARVRRWL